MSSYGLITVDLPSWESFAEYKNIARRRIRNNSFFQKQQYRQPQRQPPQPQQLIHLCPPHVTLYLILSLLLPTIFLHKIVSRGHTASLSFTNLVAKVEVTLCLRRVTFREHRLRHLLHNLGSIRTWDRYYVRWRPTPVL